jgi:hypothetical protein
MKKNILSCKELRSHISYHIKYEPALKKLGLYHIAQIEKTNIDKAYITTLIERWQSKTHTFHMWRVYGDCLSTVSLRWCLWWWIDAFGGGFLWKTNWCIGLGELKKRVLGIKQCIILSDLVWNYLNYRVFFKFVRGCHISVDWPHDGFMMEMFGTILFKDSSSIRVAAMYL